MKYKPIIPKVFENIKFEKPSHNLLNLREELTKKHTQKAYKIKEDFISSTLQKYGYEIPEDLKEKIEFLKRCAISFSGSLGYFERTNSFLVDGKCVFSFKEASETKINGYNTEIEMSIYEV